MDIIEDVIKRFEALNDSRDISKEAEELLNDEDNNVDYDEDDYEDDAEYDDSYYGNRRPYFSNRYRNKLMLSEWMLEVPENFESDWVMIPCPVGKRCLVIAMQGQTRAYTRQGNLLYTFHSALPGGSYQTKMKSKDVTLDCIYSDVSQTFYVLDVLTWNKQVMYDTDTEFRLFWLATKFQEFPKIQTVSKANPYAFTLLTNLPCHREIMEKQMQTPFEYELDGLLFYHKSAYYSAGSTPLAVWLKAYMLPEILNIQVSEKFLSLAPISYLGFASHADEVRTRKVAWEKKAEEGRSKGKKGGSKGDAGMGGVDEGCVVDAVENNDLPIAGKSGMDEGCVVDVDAVEINDLPGVVETDVEKEGFEDVAEVLEEETGDGIAVNALGDEK